MQVYAILSIARLEARMQFRRRYVWLILAILLFFLWFLVSPFNDPGMVYSADKLAAHSLKLSILFTSLLMGFLVSDRILRDEFLKVRESIIIKPIGVKDYVLGKCLGSTVYCLCMLILPIWAMVQLEQIVYAGRGYYDPLPFLKAYSFFPLLSVFFIVSMSLCVSTILGDAMKYFMVFTLIWCCAFFITTSNTQSFIEIIDFSGNSLGGVLFPSKYSPPTGKMYSIFFLNVAFLGLGALASIAFVSRHLRRESALTGSLSRKCRNSAVNDRPGESRALVWYNKRLLKWNAFKSILAMVVVLSAILVKGCANDKVHVVRLYFEAVLPLVFSFTTTHIFSQDKTSRVLEIVLSKPVSRAQLLLGRYLLLIAPSIIAAGALLLMLGTIYGGIHVPTLIFASISTLIFMCTLSMSVGLLTNDSRFGAVVTSFWFILWMNPDIQDSIGVSRYSALINPFMFGFHPDSHFFASKIVLLIISSCLLYFSAASLNRPERLI